MVDKFLMEAEIRRQMRAVGINDKLLKETRFGNFNLDCADGTRMSFTQTGYIRRRYLGPSIQGHFCSRHQWIIKRDLNTMDMVGWLRNHPLALFGRKNHVAVMVTS